MLLPVTARTPYTLNMKLMACRQFSALYELTQPLGRGSFKTTYLARERRGSGARVAVSVLNKERAGTTVEHNLHLIEQEVCQRPAPLVVTILVRPQPTHADEDFAGCML